LSRPVYNEENTSSKAIAPVYDQLAGQLSRPNKVTFTKVSTVQQAQIAESYNVTKYHSRHPFTQERKAPNNA
jgi:hypothetical protein